MILDETKYHQLIDKLQQQVEDRLETVDFDVDVDSANGILTIEFENGSQIILSRQAPLCQLWVAAKSGGYHLAYDTQKNTWLVLDGSESVNNLLQRLVKEQSDEALSFCLE